MRDNWGTVDPVGKGQLEGWCPHNVDRVRVFYESMMKQDLHNGCRHRVISSLLCAVGQEVGNSIQASKRGFTLVASSTLNYISAAYCPLPKYPVVLLGRSLMLYPVLTLQFFPFRRSTNQHSWLHCVLGRVIRLIIYGAFLVDHRNLFR